MKRRYFTVALVIALTGGFLTSSCIGSFGLTKKILAWNKQVGNKVVNELVFIGFLIVPVYLVGVTADMLILNSIEFWSGSNPVNDTSSTVVRGSDGIDYLVECSPAGYRITSKADGSVLRLDFHPETDSWTTPLLDGTDYELITFIDSDRVRLPDGCGGMTEMRLSDVDLVAHYRAEVSDGLVAAR